MLDKIEIEKRCAVLIQKGFKYDNTSDEIIGSSGAKINRKYYKGTRINFKHKGHFYNLLAEHFKNYWKKMKIDLDNK
jgi:hypothetical protein